MQTGRYKVSCMLVYKVEDDASSLVEMQAIRSWGTVRCFANVIGRRYLASKSKELHNDLESFAKHVVRTDVNQKSTWFRGTLYEYTVKYVLEKELKIRRAQRCGRAGDMGVDLTGYYSPESNDTEDLLLLVQCKSSSTKLAGKLFREMAGVFSSARIDPANTLMIAASPSFMTKPGMEEFMSSTVPMAYFQISTVNTLPLHRGRIEYPEQYLIKRILTNYRAKDLFQERGIKWGEQYI